jgi:TPR repeat protein
MMISFPVWVAAWVAAAGIVQLSPQDLPNPTPEMAGAIKDFEERQFSAAVDAFKAAAEKGDVNGEYAYGVCLENGIGAARDFAQAERFFRRAAAKNHRAAQTALGMMLTMKGLPSDVHAEGISWLQKSADAGDHLAARQLGDYLVAQPNVDVKTREENLKKAHALFEKGAAAGDPEAKFRYGLMIQEGTGDEKQDVARGLQVIEEAAQAGSVEASVNLGRQHQLGLFVKQDFAKARDYYERAVKAGKHPEAQFSLGKLYEEGLGVPKDLDRAVFYYRQAAEQKHANALVQLGICYDNGLGVEKDEKMALKFFQEAADLGSGLGLFNVAVCHDLGKSGLKADPVAAAKWFIRSGEADYPLAMNEMGIRYREGRGVLKDATAAVAWFDKAATVHSFPAAQFNLGNMFELGVAVPQSYQRAGELYTLAALAGRPDAKHLLARLFLRGLGIARDPVKAYVLYSEAALAGSDPSTEARQKLEQQMTPEELAKAKEMLEKTSSASPQQTNSQQTAPPSKEHASGKAESVGRPETDRKSPQKESEKPATIRKPGKR